MTQNVSFTAGIVKGAGRGRKLGTPTFNLDLKKIPQALSEGVYAVRACLGDEKWHQATMHYGPRPTFGDMKSCEVHLLTEKFQNSNSRFQTLTVEVVERLRDIKKFESAEALIVQLRKDAERAREILHALPPQSQKL